MKLFETKNRFRTQPARGIRLEYKRGVYINFLTMYVFFKDRNNLTGTYVMTSMEGDQSGPRPVDFTT